MGIFREFFLKPGDEPVCLDITLNNDNLIEGREFFLLALKDLRWGEITTTAVVIINDDDGKREGRGGRGGVGRGGGRGGGREGWGGDWEGGRGGEGRGLGGEGRGREGKGVACEVPSYVRM